MFRVACKFIIYVNNCPKKMRLYRVLLYFMQTALHVSDDTLIHRQEHIQIVITTSDAGLAVFATVC